MLALVAFKDPMRTTLTAVATSVLLLACVPHPRTPSGAPPPRATLIRNATVIDGTGTPGRTMSVRVTGGQVAEMGALTPAPDDSVVDGTGLVLAPGFIDTHTHYDETVLHDRATLTALSQGITTVVVGQDGDSPFPLTAFFATLDSTPAAINVASYAGHGTIRRAVMGDDYKRAARPDEIARMQTLLRHEMDAGALGLSTGLEYDPGIYSTTDELVTLARVASAAGGRYISHIRSEDRAFWSAVDELITIGREAHIPVQVSHAKLAMRSIWGQAGRFIAKLDSARAGGVDVTADVYPYTYWHSTLTVLFPQRNFADRDAATFVLREVAAPEGLLLSAFAPQPSYVGKTVADISALRGTDPATTLMALIAESRQWERTHPQGDDGRVEGVIGTSMDERDVERIIRWPFANFCSDGSPETRHPRGHGTYPRILGRYVRERHVLTLEEALRKMTSLAATNVGIPDRGLLAPGRPADLVLFDPATIVDRATTTDPYALSTGVHAVWVNGVLVYRDGVATGRFPGRVLRRPAH
jgi:N-acyl-D-amino-acid deacylase